MCPLTPHLAGPLARQALPGTSRLQPSSFGFCEVRLVSGTTAIFCERCPDPEQTLLTGSASGRLPSTYFFSYTSRVSAPPLFPRFSRPPNRSSFSSIRPVTPLRLLISPFSLLYILGAGSHLLQARLRRYPNECVLYFGIVQLITFIFAAAPTTDRVIHIHILTARHHSISVHGRVPQKLYAFLTA